MSITTINGDMLKNMITAGANAISAQKAKLDALNVFPVPDGDTGTNMSFTVLAAEKSAAAVTTNNAADVAKAASSGALRGARGNSGVILSQLFRGFAKGIEGHATANTVVLAQALTKASETAYRAVMKPKEGTMLTIGREVGEKAASIAPAVDDVIKFLKEVIKHGNDVLKKTPEMLPALKQAGVVDSGGKGIMVFLEGALACAEAGFKVPESTAVAEEAAADFSAISHDFDPNDITFLYCTEFLIHTANGAAESAEEPLKAYFEKIGDSVVVVGDDNIIKAHVHTNNPGKALEKALTYGDLSDIKIENMKMQHEETLAAAGNAASDEYLDEDPGDPKPIGVVAISAGAGFKKLFTDIGADVVIEGGQTMNPSAEDIAAAVSRINAEHVFILPNNKNIVLAADQAKYLCGDTPLTVIPSVSMPQGVTAMLNFEPEGKAEDVAEVMKEAMANVKTGQITHAVRNTVVDGKMINEGDYLFIAEGKIEMAGNDLAGGAQELLAKMIDDTTEFVTIYYGAFINETDAEALRDTLAEKYPDCDFELLSGGQPVYYYVFGVE